MRRERGFTLVEMLVATAVGSIVVASGYASYGMIAQQYAKIQDVTAMQTSSRSILGLMERDIRMAGFEWRDDSGTMTYGSISEVSCPVKGKSIPCQSITFTDSGNNCCDEVTVVYDHHDEASNKTERVQIRYWVEDYAGTNGTRGRLLRKKNILGKNKKVLSTPITGSNDVLADYVEDMQFSDPADDINPGFVKLDANGNGVSENTTQWSCVKDTNTGLTWETKRKKFEQGLHSMGNSYVFQTHHLRNGYCFFPESGTREGGKPGGTYCTVSAFTERVNTEALCGFSNWRLPTVEEFKTIDESPRFSNPPVDRKFFPNITDDYHTSSTWTIKDNKDLVYVRLHNKVLTLHGGPADVRPVLLVTEGEATTLVSINLILRTKQPYGADSYTKKDHFGGNYKINKNDGYKRQEYSSTVRVRNAS